MRNFLKKITHPFLKFGLQLFYFKPRKYCYDGICLKIHPDVFPPQLTLSTKILLDFISEINLNGKSFLELGCGSGIISLLAAKKRAIVTATDINKTALEFIIENSKKNHLELSVLESDLFDELKNQSFDYIIINPPYYPKKPNNIKENAWFCGENFEYFKKLFFQLPNFINKNNFCYMILSEDCELEKIKAIAEENRINFNLILEKKVALEKNYIFELSI
jgi:release factor glutamine methyltransferase